MSNSHGEEQGADWDPEEDDKYVHYGDFIAFAGASVGGFLGADAVLSDTLFFENVDVPREHDIPDMQDGVFTVRIFFQLFHALSHHQS